MHYRIAIIVTATALGLLLGVPYGLYAWADSALESEPCAAGVEQAPEEEFFRAVAVLDAVAVLPWFTDLASVRSASASRHCLVVYQDACDVPRDEAVAAAHAALASRLGAAEGTEGSGERPEDEDSADGVAASERSAAHSDGDLVELAGAARDTDWQHHVPADAVESLCDGWQDWRVWLADSGLDASAACPICG